MLRKLHSVPGLIAAIVLTVMALSGTVLSINPAVELARTPSPGGRWTSLRSPHG
jgi:sulfite reductase (NADPH) flavoprotein alpha-component